MGPDLFHHKFRFPRLSAVLRCEIAELFPGPDVSSEAIFGNTVYQDTNLVPKLRSMRAFLQQMSRKILPPVSTPIGLLADLLYRLLALPLARGSMDALLRNSGRALQLWTDCVAELAELVNSKERDSNVLQVFIEELTNSFAPVAASMVQGATVGQSKISVLFPEFRQILSSLVEQEETLSVLSSTDDESKRQKRDFYQHLTDRWMPIVVPKQPPAQLIRCLFALIFRAVPSEQRARVLPPAIDLLAILVSEVMATSATEEDLCSSRLFEASLATGRLVEHLRGLMTFSQQLPVFTDVLLERRLQRLLRELSDYIKRDKCAARDTAVSQMPEGLRRVEALRRRQFEILNGLVDWHLTRTEPTAPEDFLEFVVRICEKQQLSHIVLRDLSLFPYCVSLKTAWTASHQSQRSPTAASTLAGLLCRLTDLTTPLHSLFPPQANVMIDPEAFIREVLVEQNLVVIESLSWFIAFCGATHLRGLVDLTAAGLTQGDSTLVILLVRGNLLSKACGCGSSCNAELVALLLRVAIAELNMSDSHNSADRRILLLSTLLLAVNQHLVQPEDTTRLGPALLSLIRERLRTVSDSADCSIELRIALKLLLALCSLAAETKISQTTSCCESYIEGIGKLAQVFRDATSDDASEAQQIRMLTLFIVEGVLPLVGGAITHLLRVCDVFSGSERRTCLTTVDGETTASSFATPDPAFLVSQIFDHSIRYSTFTALLSPIIPFVLHPLTPRDLQCQALIHLVLINLILLGKPSALRHCPLPPLLDTHQAWDDTTVAVARLPVYALCCLRGGDEPSSSLTTPSYRELSSAITSWSSGLAVSFDVPHDVMCIHCLNSKSSDTNRLSPLMSHIAGLLKNPGNVDKRGLQEKQATYWSNSLGYLCIRCFSQEIAIPVAGWKRNPSDSSQDEGSTVPQPVLERVARFPESFQLLLVLAGLDPLTPMFRESQQVSLSCSPEILRVIEDALQILYSNTERLPSLPYVTRSFAIPECLASLLVLGAIGDSRAWINWVRYALTDGLTPDPLLLPFGIYLPSLEDEDHEGLVQQSPSILRGRFLLLHLLESFEICSELLGLPVALLQKISGPLGGCYPISRNILPNRLTDLSIIDVGRHSWGVGHFYMQCQTLSQSCLYPPDLQSPALVAARFLVDRFRVLITLPPLSTPDTLRIAGSFNVTAASFDELFNDAQQLRRKLVEFETSTSVVLDPLGHGIRVSRLTQRSISNNTWDTTCSAENVCPAMSWLPPPFMQGFLFRGLTPAGISCVLVHVEGLIRRLLAPGIATPNKGPCDIVLGVLLDTCTGAARELGLGSFPFLLALLDTRPLLALIASPSTTDPRELQQHLRLLLWWYGFLESHPGQTVLSSPLSGLLEEHLSRAAYHPLGRRTTHHVSKLVGPLVPEEYRGLFVVANCGTWLSHAAPRLSFPSVWASQGALNPGKLQEAWAFVTRYLRQSGSVAKRLSLDGERGAGVAKIVESDVERSEKTLQESGEVLLLLRDMWDFTVVEDFETDGPAQSSVLDPLIHRIGTVRQALGQGHDDSMALRDGCLPKERFLQLMEMLRCLWTLPSPTLQSRDTDGLSLAKAFLVDSIAVKAFRAVEPLSAPLPIDGTLALYGVTARTQALYRSSKNKSMEERCLTWRLCKVAHLYLTLLARGVISEAGEKHLSPLERHVALIFTLLASLAEVTAALAPVGMFRNWDLLVSNVPPAALYPFAPAIVLRIVQLRNDVVSVEGGNTSHVVKPFDKTLFRLVTQMRTVESDSTFSLAGCCLSAFCEVLLRFPCAGGTSAVATEEVLSRPGKQTDDLFERLSRELFAGAGVALASEELSTESKSACLEALTLGFKHLGYNSILDFQQKAKGTADQGASLIQACLTLAASCAEGGRHHEPVSVTRTAVRRAGEVLGLCGAPQPSSFGGQQHIFLTSHQPTRHITFPWWDSCGHFLALRAVEQLFYPNIHNRLSLFCCQELLKYLDVTDYENACAHHDRPETDLRIAELLSDQTKSLAQSLKSSSYVISGVPRGSEDCLQCLAEQLMQSLPSTEADVFRRSGLQLTSHLPDILRFLFPRLLLTSLSASSSTSEAQNHNPAEVMAAEITKILERATEAMTSGGAQRAFSLYGPARTCQVIFEALDMLQGLVHVYLNSDGHTLPLLQEQSKTDLHLRQCLSLSLSRGTWTAIQRFLQEATARPAAIAAAKCGAYSRSLFYLESTYSSRIPWGNLDSEARWSLLPGTPRSQQHQEEEELVDAFVNAFRGLENWDDIRGSYRALPARKCPTERVALELQSQGKSKAAALEYFRLAKVLRPRTQEFSCKALRSLVTASAYGDFLLAYADAAVDVKAACLPLLQRVLWHSGRWGELEKVTQLLEEVWQQRDFDPSMRSVAQLRQWDESALEAMTDSAEFDDVTASTVEVLILPRPPPSDIRTQESFVPCLIDVLPSIADICRFTSLWSPSDIATVLSGGVVAALHCRAPSLVKQRMDLFQSVAVRTLAATAGESYGRSYAGLVPLQLAADFRTLIKDGASRFDACLNRVDLLIPSPAILWDMLTSLKLALEELEDISGSLAFALRISKLLRKTFHPTDATDIMIPGALQLSDLLTLAEGDPFVSSSQLYALRIELAKSLPLERRMETLRPICGVNDKAAAMYGTLEAAQHHLFSEKLFVLQHVVEQHPHSERAHRRLADLIDAQIHQVLQRSIQYDRSSIREPHKLSRRDSSTNPLIDLPHLPRGWSLMTLVESSIHHHLEAAAWAVTTRRVRGHLLRFLQMLVDVFFNDLSVQTLSKTRQTLTGSSSSNSTDIQDTFVKRVCLLIQGKLERIPPAHWYLSVAQLVARSQHNQLGPKVFQPLLARLLQYTPAQMAWQLGPLFCSERKDRREVAAQILAAARSNRNSIVTPSGTIASTSPANAKAQSWNLERHIERTVTFASALISLATNPFSAPPQSTGKDPSNAPLRDKISIAQDFPELSVVLKQPPARSGTPPVRILMPLLSQLDLATEDTLAHEDPRIAWVTNVGDTIVVMRSKQRPKRMTLLGSDGREHYWLVKRESRGDLRKDTRLMEISGYVNNWLEKVEKAAQRQLKICRYSVIPLNEVTGLIEWLPNLTTLRAAVLDTWETDMGQAKFMILMKKVIARYNRHKGNPAALENDYHSTLQVFQPVLQKFFFNRFGNNIPVWYSCRKHFSESLASWSILGFILGLGDRHGENVLLNLRTGQVVHVDFDCLFGKGLHLPVPEIVPFRLTPNLVTTLGFGGLYGNFLSACVETMTTLRQYRGDCLSVLQSFVFDPSIEWTRTGKTVGHGQPAEDDYVGGGARARQLISEIEEKLNGGINFRSQRSIQKSVDSPLTLDEIYHHVTLWVTEHGVDVHSQVEELIRAANCPKNLSLMYVGWMPWL